MGPLVTCEKCSWISYAVSKAYAEKEVEEFLAFYDSMPKDQAENLYGKRRGHNYKCLRCNGDKFRPTTTAESNAIYGSTISPVVWEAPKEVK